MKSLKISSLILGFIFLCGIAYAEPSIIQRVTLEPLQGGVSFNSATTLYRDWVTAPSTEMRGRKSLLILNTSTSKNLYLTDVSGSSIKGTLYPRERATFAASSNLHIYVSGDSVTFETWEIR